MKSPIQRQLEIFSAALEHSIGLERDAFLAQACAGDDALRQCVETLLAGHQQAGTFLAQPAGPFGPTGTHLLPATEKPGDRIGRYKLLQQIGEGGCGTVYMAEQEEPVRRRVALKVIRLGMDTKSVVARFEAERQALALMDHPNIAKVFDGGATESGRPYFVMELVRGIKITEYCDQAHLFTEERLELFTQVCQAVQHAHQKGVIHRDIKPSNILVTVNDGVAVPKVIDFGIAKATDQRLTDKSYFTEFHAFIGTPAYTSPEQAEMSSLDIDTRSDVYSLGVLLYEMLTGQTPFPAERLLQSGLDEMRRIIREEEPPRPSTRLTTLGLAEAAELSQKRQAKIPQLASAVQGDLDWIVMKALEKDRTRRYATSLDFAADLQRHLNNEAVLARPPSLAYKFQRAVRRNQGAFAAAAAVFLALLAGLGLTAWQAVRASRAEHAARAQSEQARADRDRAVFAESNATVKANEATNALLTANERMVKLNVAEGWRRVAEGDHFGALLPFAEAFALEQDKPDRAEIHQMRLASILQYCPKLVNVWSVGTNINHAEFSRDGSRLLVSSTASHTQALARIWDTTTHLPSTVPMEHQGQINSLEWSNDETSVLTASQDGTAQAWDAASGQPIGPPLRHESSVARARFGFGDTNVLTLGAVRQVIQGDTNEWWNWAGLTFWDRRAGKQIWSTRIAPPAHPRNPIALSPDNDLVVSAYEAFSAKNGSVLPGAFRQFSGRERSVKELFEGTSWSHASLSDDDSRTAEAAAVFNCDGTRLFVGQTEWSWAVLRDGRRVDQVVKRWNNQGSPYFGRFSATGAKLATANDDLTVRIWNSTSGAPETSPMEHRALVRDVNFSRDGTWVATGTETGEAQIWDAASGKPLTCRLPHDSPVVRVTFSRERTQLMVVGESGSIAVWSLQTARVPRFTWPIPNFSPIDREPSTRVSEDGRFVIAQSYPGTITSVMDLADGSIILPRFKLGGDAVPVDSHLVVDLSLVHKAAWCVVDLKDGRTSTNFLDHYLKAERGTWHARLTDNGRWMVGYRDGGSNLVVLNSTNAELSASLACPRRIITSADVRPDGKQAVVAIESGKLFLWDVSSRTPFTSISVDKTLLPRFSVSGQWIFDGGQPFWFLNTRTWKTTKISERGLDVMETSPDESWVLCSVDSSRACRVENLTGNGPKSLNLGHRGRLFSATFSADSKVVVTAGQDYSLRFWHLPDGEIAHLTTVLSSPADEVHMIPNGRGFVTAHDDNTLLVWEWPKTRLLASEWLAMARLFFNGHRNDARDADLQSALQRQSFRDQWLALRVKHSEVFTVSAAEIDAWHRHEAWRCESTKDWSNSVVHLNALLETHPDSSDFLPRRAAAYVALANELVAAETSVRSASVPVPTSAAKNLLERALADYARTLAWVDGYPAIAKESRKPFVEKRREIYLKLGRRAEADTDERELKDGFDK